MKKVNDKGTSFPPSRKLLDENRNRLFSLAGKVSEDLVGLIDIPITHVTVSDRAISILESGEIRSIAMQESLGWRYERMSVNTDELDRKHGFDKYVFTTLWRVATHNGWEVVFVFPAGKILQKPGVVFSLKEIADYGAFVSPEAEAVYRARTGKSPNAQNAKAVREFFQNVVRGTDAARVMSGFLQKHYSKYVEYLMSLTYPGENLKLLPETGTHNVWGGPQCMVPERLELDECSYLLVPSKKEKAAFEEAMAKIGRKLAVKSVEEHAPISPLPPPGTDNFMRAMNLVTYRIPPSSKEG